MFDKLKYFILGKPQNPLSKESRRHLALVAFLAWVGLGADGLSSSCYGPALSYLALGSYHEMALYLAILTAITVFLIALSYNRVIELFPNGGGGYKVANVLLGSFAGLFSGTALLIDYMLTISISIASGVEAIFSFLPHHFQSHKVIVEIIAVFFLMFLNIRGIKESIKILLPIFLGFIITHIAIIGYGIAVHGKQLPVILHGTISDTHRAITDLGLLPVIAIILRAYSLGAGTYTGLEAVSNNVNLLAEPRVRTGRTTMLYMAFSLSLVAAGIILLYLLWHVTPVSGMTLNAVVFQKILGHSTFAHGSLIVLLLFEAGLLVVGGNTGFLGGPAVLANMALDDWVPRRFATLSSRLVKQNGVLLFGVFAAILLILTDGSIEMLVVFYSMNVFITFSISLCGLTVYWWKSRAEKKNWFKNLLLSTVAFIVSLSILIVMFITKLGAGSGVAVLITIVLAGLAYILKRYYEHYEKLKHELDQELEIPLGEEDESEELPLDKKAPTAVFLVKKLGATMHTVLWVERMFPKHFKNYIFISYGLVDNGSYGCDAKLKQLQNNTNRVLNYLMRFAKRNGIATMSEIQYGANPLEDITEMAEKINQEYNNSVYFCAKYIYKRENLLTRLIHNDFIITLQRRLQNIGTKMLIVPLNLG